MRPRLSARFSRFYMRTGSRSLLATQLGMNSLPRSRHDCLLKVCFRCSYTTSVLHLDSSPDGSSVVSAAADETLRFWDIFGRPSKSKLQPDTLLKEQVRSIESKVLGLGSSFGFLQAGFFRTMTVR